MGRVKTAKRIIYLCLALVMFTLISCRAYVTPTPDDEDETLKEMRRKSL